MDVTNGGIMTSIDATQDDEWTWLEQVDDPAARAWTAEQAARTEAHLAALPVRERVREVVRILMHSETGRYSHAESAAGAVFALKSVPPKPQPVLVRIDDVEDPASETVLLDTSLIDEAGTTAIDWFRPSPDGTTVAVSLSRNGSEDGYVSRFDARTGDPIDSDDALHVGVFGSVAWRQDGSGVWYTRFRDFASSSIPSYQELAYHRWGTAMADDSVELAGCFHDDAIVQMVVTSTPDGRWVLDSAQWGDSGEWEFYVRAQDGGEWWRVCSVDARASYAAIHGDRLYAVVRDETPTGRILALDLVPGATLDSAVEIAAPDLPIDAFDLTTTYATGGVLPTAEGTYVRLVDDGVSRLSLIGADDGASREVQLTEPIVTVTGLTRAPGDGALFAIDSHTRPREWWIATGTSTRPTAICASLSSPPIELDVTRESALADDGVDVPVTVLRGRGWGPGPRPTIVLAYGAYGLSESPSFRPYALAWVQLGGVFAIAHVRGGGERGTAWHHAARLTTKRRSVDDLYAVVTHLVQNGTATTESIAVAGGSAGGLLTSAYAVVYPESVQAVAMLVPLTDLLNFHNDPNGVYNVPEFGNPDDPAQEPAMRALSPYENVRTGVHYPSVILTGGDNDVRVPSYHPKKMAARLQKVDPSATVLLRVTGGGHGIGSSLDEDVAEWTDILTFFADELGLTPDA